MCIRQIQKPQPNTKHLNKKDSWIFSGWCRDITPLHVINHFHRHNVFREIPLKGWKYKIHTIPWIYCSTSSRDMSTNCAKFYRVYMKKMELEQFNDDLIKYFLHICLLFHIVEIATRVINSVSYGVLCLKKITFASSNIPKSAYLLFSSCIIKKLPLSIRLKFQFIKY